MRGNQDKVGLPSLVLAGVACLAALAMVFHVTADVLSKFFLNDPLDGTLEIVAGYYMVIVIFFPLAQVTLKEGQIFVELFTRKLSKRALAGIDAGAGVLTLFYVGVLTWQTGAEAVHRTSEGEVWSFGAGDFLIWPSRWILTIGVGLMVVYVVIRLAGDLAKSFDK